METSTVTVTAKVEEQSVEELPAELMAYLSLKLSSTAKPALITLRTSDAQASRVGSSEPLPDVRSSDTQLEVQAEGFSPTVVCFFFSH